MSGYVLEIERLLLNGLIGSPERAEWIRRQAEQELVRLLDQGDLPRPPEESREIQELDAERIALPLDRSDEELARGIAVSVYRLLASGPWR